MGLLSRKSSTTVPEDDSIKGDTLIEELKLALPNTALHSLIATGECLDHPAHIDAMLLRFLVAEKFDVHNAKQRLLKQAAWRATTLPTGSMTDEEAAEGLAHDKVMLQPAGADGHPLLIVLGARHLPMSDIAACERFIVYSLEAACKLCSNDGTGDGKLIAVMDLKGLKWQNLDAAALKSCFSVLNNHYPERVLRIYMLDAPMIFDGLWRVVSPFIDPVSRSKVRFVYSPAAHKKLLEYVDPAILPLQYGGTAGIRRVQQAVEDLRKHVLVNSKQQPQQGMQAVESEASIESIDLGKCVVRDVSRTEGSTVEEDSEDTFFDASDVER